jgi:hypothetical protein
VEGAHGSPSARHDSQGRFATPGGETSLIERQERGFAQAIVGIG